MKFYASSPAQRSRPQSGYALLFAIFLAASMFTLAFAAAPSILNQGRRERERELIWRGNQYVRGIRLYFQKNGRFPQNKEELLKGTLDIHFVRKAYTDPVGAAGDDWRFIYVAPSGQLTGSVRYRSLQEMAAEQGGGGQNSASLAALFGGPAGQPAGAGAAGARGGAGQAGAAGAGRGAGAGVGPRGGAPGTQAAPGAETGEQEPAGIQPMGGLGTTQVPLEAVEGPVFGASIIGVASKVKKPSLLIYQKRETYFEWEFIWNPLLGGAGTAPGTQQAPAAGQAPTGGGIGIAPLGGGRGGAPVQVPGMPTGR